MSQPIPGKGDILIIDDDPGERNLLIGLLTQYGYQVQQAPNGALGLEMARKSLPDLILLDVMMPQMDGYQTCQQLKDDKHTSDIPIIFISALEQVEDKVKAFAAGAVDYIPKVFDLNEVLARVKTHLTLRAAQRELEEKSKAIKQQNTFLKTVIDSLVYPFYVVNADDHTIQIANQAANENVSRNTTCYALTHKSPRLCGGQGYPCPLETAKKTKQPAMMEHTYTVDGLPTTVEIYAQPILDEQGRVVQVIEYILDVTERKQGEEILRQMHETLERRVVARTQDLQTEIVEHKETESLLREQQERSRILTARLAEVEEAERRQLARELHDQAGQNLTALNLNMEIIRQQISNLALSQKINNSLTARLNDASSLVETTAQRIRNVMDNLRPPALEEYGLPAALRLYGATFSARTQVPVFVRGEDLTPRPTPAIETALFRIAQEALTNVARHAQATQVEISIEVNPKTIRLIIADDGVGFDSERLPEFDGHQHWGLLTMAERAETVGGSSWVESTPDGGAKVITEVKMIPAAAIL